MKESITYGLPVFGHSMGVVSLSSMDRLFLTAYIGAAATGIYGVASSLVGLTNIAITAFSLSWTPIIFERLKQAKEGNKFYLVSRTYKVAAVMAVGMVGVGAILYPTLIRMNGPVGAAQANCAIFFMRFLAMVALGCLVCPMPWLRVLREKVNVSRK